MEDYDVIVVGGGIAGSIAAKFTAKNGLKTLLIEKEKTPREKACSGIQFGYFEKIIGEKIPQEKLCNAKITKAQINLPNGFKITAPFKVLNFMRNFFDDWLNDVAQNYGATFWDRTKFLSFKQNESHIRVFLEKTTDEGKTQGIALKTDYLIDATGLRPVIRKKIRPQDFENQTTGATLSYYVKCSNPPLLKPNILYQFWDVEFNDIMFAWVYVKTLEDDEDYWVVGTGCLQGNVKNRQEKFFNYIQEKYNLHGEIVKTEAYASNVTMTSENKIWLGEQNILMVGDAAGFVDPVRGVGMDAAALSARFAANAIASAKHEGENALEVYKELIRNTVEQTRKNQDRGINHFDSNDELDAYMKRTMLKRGLGLIFQSFLNRFRSVENLALLPP